MQTLNSDLYDLLSFPDFFVEKMNFDEKKKELTIVTDGGWLDIDSGVELKQCRLFFYQWKNLVIKKFHSMNEKWEYLDCENFELLEDLPEVKISESEVKLCGFGKTSGWLEWIFKDLKVQIEFSR